MSSGPASCVSAALPVWAVSSPCTMATSDMGALLQLGHRAGLDLCGELCGVGIVAVGLVVVVPAAVRVLGLGRGGGLDDPAPDAGDEEDGAGDGERQVVDHAVPDERERGREHD